MAVYDEQKKELIEDLAHETGLCNEVCEDILSKVGWDYETALSSANDFKNK